jgi:haloacid dehalogenase superfamily, subfamily IA, variant 1 with third motif having Dx(3-4)D or Dx(3-4)E
MWSGWAVALADALQAATGRSVEVPLFAMLGYDAATGVVMPGGGLAATPMARLRERAHEVLVEAGLTDADAEHAMDVAWHAPDPVGLARPLTDLHSLFGRLRAGGQRIAIATSDDRDPTERTLAALGVANEIEAVVCADDGVAVKPEPDMVLHLCHVLGIAPGRTAVVGDTPADLTMGRRAGAGLVIGVLSGVGDAEHLGPAADLVLRSVADLQTD